MAFWVVGGGRPLVGDAPAHVAAYIDRSDAAGLGGKRRGGGHPEDTASDPGSYDYGLCKRPRLDDWGRVIGYDYDYAPAEAEPADSLRDRSGSVRVKNLAFLVIREREPTPPPTPPPPPLSPELRIAPGGGFGFGPAPGPVCPMERTQSGLSISSDTASVHSPIEDDGSGIYPPLLSDLAAARLVRQHVASFHRRRHRNSQHGRILKALINPSRGADFPLDNDALRSIFSAANELFFANRLTQRVAWDWSHPASPQYQSHIVGTTALRRSALLGGYETLIVLSSPILKDTKYNRRLLISTFLHEMIHSFLFITCGLKARECGGHTEGFRQIAETIDIWVGEEHLRLRDMEADLERFIDDDSSSVAANRYASNRVAYSSASNNIHTNNYPEWPAGEERRTVTNDYLTAGPPGLYHRQAKYEDWEWHDREGFRARDVRPTAPSSYTY